MVAHALEAATRCGMCGTAEWEWLEEKFPYMPIQRVCQGCQAKDLMRDDHQRPPPGSAIVLVPQKVGTAIMEEAVEREQRRAIRDAQSAQEVQ